MASHHEKQEAIVNGRHIFLHKNGQTLYYNPLTKKAYIITKDEAKTYTYYNVRGLLAIASGYLIIIFSHNPLLGILSGLVVWGVLAFFFYKQFLPKLPTQNNFVLPTKSSLAWRLAEQGTIKNIALTIVAFILGGFLLVATYQSKAALYVRFINAIFGLASLGLGFYCLFAAYLASKNKTK